jgi:hypothetical protein
MEAAPFGGAHDAAQRPARRRITVPTTPASSCAALRNKLSEWVRKCRLPGSKLLDLPRFVIRKRFRALRSSAHRSLQTSGPEARQRDNRTAKANPQRGGSRHRRRSCLAMRMRSPSESRRHHLRLDIERYGIVWLWPATPGWPARHPPLNGLFRHRIQKLVAPPRQSYTRYRRA